MQGKPYAGNPHVRFDEGAGAPRHSGRSALLYRKLISVLALAGAVTAQHGFVKRYVEPERAQFDASVAKSFDR